MRDKSKSDSAPQLSLKTAAAPQEARRRPRQPENIHFGSWRERGHKSPNIHELWEDDTTTTSMAAPSCSESSDTSLMVESYHRCRVVKYSERPQRSIDDDTPPPALNAIDYTTSFFIPGVTGKARCLDENEDENSDAKSTEALASSSFEDDTEDSFFISLELSSSASYSSVSSSEYEDDSSEDVESVCSSTDESTFLPSSSASSSHLGRLHLLNRIMPAEGEIFAESDGESNFTAAATRDFYRHMNGLTKADIAEEAMRQYRESLQHVYQDVSRQPILPNHDNGSDGTGESPNSTSHESSHRSSHESNDSGKENKANPSASTTPVVREQTTNVVERPETDEESLLTEYEEEALSSDSFSSNDHLLPTEDHFTTDEDSDEEEELRKHLQAALELSDEILFQMASKGGSDSDSSLARKDSPPPVIQQAGSECDSSLTRKDSPLPVIRQAGSECDSSLTRKDSPLPVTLQAGSESDDGETRQDSQIPETQREGRDAEDNQKGFESPPTLEDFILHRSLSLRSDSDSPIVQQRRASSGTIASQELKSKLRSQRIRELLVRAKSERQLGKALLQETDTLHQDTTHGPLYPTPIEHFILYRSKSLRESDLSRGTDPSDDFQIPAPMPRDRVRSTAAKDIQRRTRIRDLLIRAQSERQLGEVLLDKLEHESQNMNIHSTT